MAGGRHVARIALVGIAMSGAFVARSADAHPTTRFRFVADADVGECPTEEAMRAAVTAHLGYDPFAIDAGETIVASVSRARGALHGSIDVYDANGERRGHQDIASATHDCAQLVDALALSISVAIDPIGLSAPTPSTTPPPPPASPPPPLVVAPAASEPPQSASVTSPVRRAASPRLDVEVGPVFTINALPEPSLGAELAGGARYGLFRLDLEGQFVSTVAATGTMGPGRFSATLLTATIAPCLYAAIVYGCALGSIGALEAAGTGFDEPHGGARAYYAVGGRAGVELALPLKLLLRIQVDGLVPLRTITLTASGAPVWQSSVASFSCGPALARSFL